jgi:hypothetical protein
LEIEEKMMLQALMKETSNTASTSTREGACQSLTETTPRVPTPEPCMLSYLAFSSLIDLLLNDFIFYYFKITGLVVNLSLVFWRLKQTHVKALCGPFFPIIWILSNQNEIIIFLDFLVAIPAVGHRL